LFLIEFQFATKFYSAIQGPSILNVPGQFLFVAYDIFGKEFPRKEFRKNRNGAYTINVCSEVRVYKNI